MLAIKYKGAVIDYCSDSNSVWLDAGELEKISKSSPGKPPKKRPMRRSDPDGIAGAMIDGISINAGDIFDFIVDAFTSAV